MRGLCLHNILGNNNLTLFPPWRRNIRNDGKRLDFVSLELLNYKYHEKIL